MLLNNSRVLNENGLVFYEKDILFDNYTYSNNVDIILDIDYISAGFGIVLTDADQQQLKDKVVTYLFKIGYKTASVYYNLKNELFLEKQISVLNANTINTNMIFRITKTGKKVCLYLNEDKLYEYYLKKNLDKFNIGIYSNAGNKINNISVLSNTPNKWNINMKNTNGGYLNFSNNSFELSSCKMNAEILQDNIELTAGRYFLKFDKEKITETENNDIVCYVFKSDDDRIEDKTKNILNKDNSFVLLKKENVTLKFVGKNGKISNISISLDKDDVYVETENNEVVSNGSTIMVNIENVTKIDFKCKIFDIPKDNITNKYHGLIIDSKETITPTDAKMIFKKEYNCIFDLNNTTFYVYDLDYLLFQKKLNNVGNYITLFKNIYGDITEFKITYKNGKVDNLLTKEDNKKIIPANIKSPIIVLDNDDIPYDLSASYRRCIFDDHFEYRFTNYEREYFYNETSLFLENKIEEDVIVYGIPFNIDYDLDSIYDVSENNFRSIDKMTETYDIIEAKDLKIDYLYNTIYIKNNLNSKYQLFIVDYLKKNSYCINYNYSRFVYEIDISNREKVKLVYDGVKQGDNNLIIDNYILTDIDANSNGYVVLRKEI